MHNTPVGLKPPPTPPGESWVILQARALKPAGTLPLGGVGGGGYSLESVATTYSERVPMRNLPPQMPMPELT